MAAAHLVADNSTAGSHCEEEEEAGWLRPVGVSMGVVGSILINIGQNLQATAMQSSPEVQQNPGSSVTWRIGLGTFALGSLINFTAFAFAPTSILVPIESLQFVVNVAYGRFVNKKEISNKMLGGVLLTVSGTVLCVAFGPQEGNCFTIHDLYGFWLDWGWWGWLISSIVTALIALSTHMNYSRRLQLGDNPPHHRIVLPVTYATSSALLGGANMIVHYNVTNLLAIWVNPEGP